MGKYKYFMKLTVITPKMIGLGTTYECTVFTDRRVVHGNFGDLHALTKLAIEIVRKDFPDVEAVQVIKWRRVKN